MIDSVETDAGGVSPDLKKARRQKAATTDAARVDRLPPHSIEAERGVLGCVLLSPQDKCESLIDRAYSPAPHVDVVAGRGVDRE